MTADPILVSKNLDGLRPGTNVHARLVAAEIGSTCWLLRRSFGMPLLRALVRRGVLQFEPPLPPLHVPERSAPTHLKERPSMCCREPFPSEGNHHRLCRRCNDLAGRLSPFDE